MKRRAEISDAEAMAEIHVLSWRSAYQQILPDDLLESLSISKRREMWEREIKSGIGAHFVWDDLGEIKGFAALGNLNDSCEMGGSEVELFAIYLHPKFYGTGTGSSFWASIEEAYRGRRISLWVLEANHLARRFYEKNQFEMDSDKRSVFSWNGSDFPEVRYTKTITEQSKHQTRKEGGALPGEDSVLSEGNRHAEGL